MDNLDNNLPLQPAADHMQEQVDGLRHLVVSILILVVMMSCTLNLYLLRQWRYAKKDLEDSRPQFAQMLAGYQKSVSGFVVPITEYGRTHPDFLPVLAKYGLKPGAPTNASSPTPATTVPKK